MNYKKRILVIIIFTFSSKLFCQINQTIPEITFPSPEVSSLGRFGEVPIDSYTGQVNVNVDLDKLNFDGLIIPLSLFYNTGGIQTDQEATWVGLGWNTSFEPIITRKIRGHCDITIGSTGLGRKVGYCYTDVELPQSSGSMSNELMNKLQTHDDYYNRINGWDMEPDVFSINIFGKSSSFVLTQKSLSGGEIKVKSLDPKDNFKYEFDEVNKTFIVTDSYGFKYFFDLPIGSITAIADNFSSYFVTNIFPEVLVTSWKVTKIVSPLGNELNFKYDKSILQQSQPHIFDKKIFFGSGFIESTLREPKISKSITSNEVYYLSEIKSENFTVQFNKSSRLDVIQEGDTRGEATDIANYLAPESYNLPRKLDEVKIFNSKSTLLKKFNFYYSYFNKQYIGTGFNEPKFLRLKLDSIKRNNRLERKFDYLNSDNLPAKDTRSKDFWGFYNGKSNSYSFPTWAEGPIGDYKFVKGGDRRSDFNYGKNGLLYKIVYPTKGYTEFDYEGNTVALNSESRVTKYLYEDTEKVELFSYGENQPQQSNIFHYRGSAFSKGNSNAYCNISITSSGGADPSWCKLKVTEEDSHKIAFELINANTGVSVIQIPFSNSPDCLMIGLGVCDDPLDLSESTNYIFKTGFALSLYEVPEGDYYFKVSGLHYLGNLYDMDEGANYSDSDYGKQYNFTTKAEITISKSLIEEEYNLQVGGARIEKINNYDSNNTLIGAKAFKYVKYSLDETLEHEEDLSSGQILNELNYSNIGNYVGLNDSNCTNTFSNYEYTETSEVYSNNLNSTPNSKGSFIGYSSVKEQDINLISSSISNGSKIKFFENEQNRYEFLSNSNSIYWKYDVYFPQAKTAEFATLSLDHTNGNLIKEKIFNSKNKLIKEVMYNYGVTYPQNISYGVKPYFSENWEYNCGDLIRMEGSAFILQPYQLINESINSKIHSKTLIEYLDGKKITNYFWYDYNEYYQNIKEIHKSSSGNSLISKTYFPQDISSITSMGLDALTSEEMSAIDQLKTDHRIAEVVQIETFLNLDGDNQGNTGERINTQRTNYKIHSGIVKPADIQTLKGGYNSTTNKLQNLIIYNDYDFYGNPLEVTKADGATITYLWGYNGQYPIAKIENATINEVESKIGSVNSIDESDFTTINNLRNQLPKAMITTYEYEPLVGVTKITDPRGQKMTYEYDDFNRLKTVLDDEMKLLQEHKYHYKNQ